MRVLLRLIIGGLCLAAVLAGSTPSLADGASATGAIPGQYIVVLKPGADRAAAVASTRSLGGDVFTQYRHALKGFAARLPDTARSALAASADVEFVSEDRQVMAASCPTVTLTSVVPQCLPPGIDRIETDASSTAAGNGRDEVAVSVAVLDTGTEGSHPDINVAGGVNCTGDNRGALVDPGQVAHGTHVGGTIGAKDNGFGVVGIAPGARLYSIRVLDKQLRGTISALICGLDWVTASRQNPDPTDDIAVANMSLAASGADDGNCGRTNQDALHLAICNAAAAGVVSVAATGNSGVDFSTSWAPAIYDEVLAVTAIVDYDGKPGGLGTVPPEFPKFSCGVEDDDSAAFFSNFTTDAAEAAHTIAAPGACIYSTWSEGRYALLSGTSMATPHVAGTVALCITSGACARLTPQQIVEKIVSDAAAYSNARKNFGYGFQDDPLRPVSGKYYGYLINAGLY
jgi:subtilisin